MRYTQALAWRLRVNPACRLAAKQFVKKNPEVLKNRFARIVTNQIRDQSDAFAEFVKLTYRVDPERVQLAVQWFKERTWQEIQQQRTKR